MAATKPFVIIGSGMSGGVAARTLREEGYSGPLVMVGDEPGLPFGRPPLSKTYLRGEEGISGWLVEPEEWYDAHDVDLVRTVVARVDVAQHRVELAGRAPIEYSKLLIATGGRNRRVDIPGAQLAGVFQLRTVADCDAIRNAIRSDARAVIVGMGFIGSEVAASLRQLGVTVTAIFPGKFPLDSVLGPEVGAVMAGIHAGHGVDLVAGDTVARFEGAGRVERVVTKSGRRIDCDMAVAALGIQPSVEFLDDSGIALENGVLVDASCRTNAPDVFAAGDVANHLHPLFGRVRVEHYNNAEKQGAAAARSMLGSTADYTYLHTFWSDQYDQTLEYAGHVRHWDQFVVRGSLDERSFIGFYLENRVIRAAVGLGRGGDPELDADGEMAKAGRLIAARAQPPASLLADESTDLAVATRPG